MEREIAKLILWLTAWFFLGVFLCGWANDWKAKEGELYVALIVSAFIVGSIWAAVQLIF